MKFVKFILIGILISTLIDSYSQVTYTNSNETHIFWQPNTILTASDFKGDTTGGKYLDLYREAGIQTVAYTGLYSILNVPKKKKDRGKSVEKVYIAPAFDKSQSFTLNNDTLEIAMQQLYFDMRETWARWARMELKKYQDTMQNAYGVQFLMYATVMKDAREGNRQMAAAYTKDVFANKTPGAYLKWKDIITRQLMNTQEFATKPEDCYRFISKKPIDKNYEESTHVAGPL